ncbi:hypothetical protein Tco_0709903, partial [Tanacetum coccineum]
THKVSCVTCESVKSSISQPLVFLEACLDHLIRRYGLWELWDCQLGNLTAGKDSGGKFSDDYDSKDEVASVDNDMARSMASEMVGQDLSQELQAICDNLDIRVRGRMKK